VLILPSFKYAPATVKMLPSSPLQYWPALALGALEPHHAQFGAFEGQLVRLLEA
jgi:hypothetical protein